MTKDHIAFAVAAAIFLVFMGMLGWSTYSDSVQRRADIAEARAEIEKDRNAFLSDCREHEPAYACYWKWEMMQ